MDEQPGVGEHVDMARDKQRTPTGTAALAALERSGRPYVVHTYRHDPGSVVGYGLEAADALGVPPGRVFKTLVAEVDGEPVVAVVPVTGNLDLKALARAVGGKRAAMAAQQLAERATGYVVGGISPLGQRQRLRTVVDDTATDHDTVFVSGGKRGVDVELAPDDLADLTGATTAPIGRTS